MNTEQLKWLLENITECLEKTETLNKAGSELGCVDGTIIGTGRSDYTQCATLYNLQIGTKKFSLIDIPGIEGDESRFEETIKNSLEKAHIIFYVNGSGKKPEKETLDKIQKYMHDGTTVYAIFNTHCKPKKSRIPGIDRTYAEDLEAAYSKNQEIVKQTEEQFRSFLGDNFKGSIRVNGLLAFCALAVDQQNRTTIKEDLAKSLRSDQIKYLKEYSGDASNMVKDSHITVIEDEIEQKADNFEECIFAENFKKLDNRKSRITEEIAQLKITESKKIKGFISVYTQYQDNIRNAKDDFIFEMKHISHDAVSWAFNDLLEELFEKIELDNGKTKADELKKIFEDKKDEIVLKIQEGLNAKIIHAQDNYCKNMDEAQRRLEVDLIRQQIQFAVELSANNISLNVEFKDSLKNSLKEIGKHIAKIGTMAIDFARMGAHYGDFGAIIGAAIGAAIGIISTLINLLMSKSKRIDNAKSKVKTAIDEQIDNVSEQLENELKNINYEEKIEKSYEEMYNIIEKQKAALNRINLLLNSVYNEMLDNCRRTI